MRRAWLSPAAVLFVVACVFAQSVPLLNVLGYEYASLVGALLSILGTWHVASRTGVLTSGGGPSRWRLARARAVELTAWVVVATAIGALNMLRVRNCEPGVGLAYMVVLGWGAVPMAVATGLIIAHVASRWRRAALLLALLLLAVASTLATLALQPAIVAYDTFFGYYAGSIYDESLIGFAGHAVFRAWNVLWAVSLLATLEIARRPRVRPLIVLALTLPLLLATYALRGDLGIERTRSYVVHALGGHFENDRFEIFYDAASTNARELQLLVSDHEARYVELAEFWGVEPEHQLVSFVYANQDQKGALMGGRRTLVAKIWLGEMHITWDGLGDELLAHEMAHLFLRDYGNGPLRLASANGLIPIMALVEGAATAPAWGASELDYHHWSAAIYRLELGEDITDLLGPAGFWGRYSRRAYTLTGSFVRWLIDTHGPAPFLSAYGRGDFQSAYGRPLGALTTDWREFLDTLTLTDAQLEIARARYDRPSLFGKLCARSIATRFDEGDAAFVRGDSAEASRCYEGILADDPNNVAYRLRIAERYAQSGAAADATRHAQQIVDAEGAGRAHRDRAQELLADLAWVDGRPADALAAYESLVASAGSTGALRRLIAKRDALRGREAAPLTAAAVRRYLAERPSQPATTSLAELMRAAQIERSPVAAYLTVLRVAASDSSPTIDTLVAALPFDALDPVQQRRVLEVLAYAQSLRGDPQACESWTRAADVSPTGSELAAVAQMWLGRCRNGTLPPPEANAR